MTFCHPFLYVSLAFKPFSPLFPDLLHQRNPKLVSVGAHTHKLRKLTVVSVEQVIRCALLATTPLRMTTTRS